MLDKVHSAPVERDAEAGTCAVHVKGDSSHNFRVRKDDLLLKAAVDQSLDYPHSCRVGVCGTCKTRVVKGRVSPMIDLALSPLTNEEIEKGYVLACQAKVRSDLLVEVEMGNVPLISPRTVSSRVVGWRRLPGEVIDLRLRLDAPLPYQAGQYCTIAESGSFVQRSYSFYDGPPNEQGPGATEVGFLIKRLPGGQFSEWVFAADRSGTKIWLNGPYGLMGVDPSDRDILCVAGGTGLAPILSIVTDRLSRDPTVRATVVFGVRTSREQFAEPKLAELLGDARDRVRLVTIVSDEPAGSDWDGPTGLVTAPLDDALGVDYAQVDAFVCGSLPMVEATEQVLLQRGTPARRIHADKFIPTG